MKHPARWANGVLATVLVVCAAGLPAPAQEAATGVLVRVYEVAAALRELPEPVDGELPNEVRVSPTIDLHSDRKDFGEREGSFVTEVVGRLKVDKKGTYVFRLTSDDGAKLWIGGELVVDHDGIHGPSSGGGPCELDVGERDLRILHFEAHGGAQLRLEWRPPTAPEDRFEIVPASVLRWPPAAPRDTAPGKKRIIPGLRRGLPGDGTPVGGIHPGFDGETMASAMYGTRGRRPCSEFVVGPDLTTRPTAARIFLPQSGRGLGQPDGVPLADARYVPAIARDPAAALGMDPCQLPLIVGLASSSELLRLMPERIGATHQGVFFRFAAGFPGTLVGVDGAIPGAIVAHMAVEQTTEYPKGWALCFIRPGPDVAFEMLAVRAMSNGFEVEFTKPLDPRVGWEPESYYVEQWPFDVEQGRLPKRDGVVYPVKSASVSADRRKVFLEIENLKPSHVVYIRLLPPCVSEDGERPWSTEAWYTLNAIPSDRPGKVLTPPAQPPQNVLTEDERPAGWRLLFDGQTPRGWRGYKKDRLPDGWQVRDGCLVRVGPGGDVCTEEEFDNFELQLEWRISAGGNSGIFFRVDESANWPWETGPEMQVLDNAEHADGRNPKTSAGSNYALHAPVRDVTEPVGLFNRVRLVVNGPHVEHWLNGVKVVEYELGSPEWEQLVADSKFKNMPRFGRVARGRIVLQDHGDRVWYRNIKVRPLRP